MSHTVTVHWTCDSCGRQEDVDSDSEYSNARRLPDGWAEGYSFLGHGSFCSSSCAESFAAKDAREWAESLFAKQSEPVA